MVYDAAGRRTRLTWSDGFYVTYDYDAQNGMTAIRENGSGLLAAFAYDDLGRRTRLTRGNGATTTYGYDPASRLSALSHDLAGTAYDVGLTFGYNPAGQIRTRTASNDAYAFAGRYDVDRPYAVNGLDQYSAINAIVPTYDGKGNLRSAGSTVYEYSTLNQLVTTSAPAKRLVYGPGGLLESIQDPPGGGGADTGFQRLDGRIVDEVAGTAGFPIQRRYVFGPGSDEPLVWYEGAGTGDRRYLMADERGSVIAVTDGAGTATAINAYDEHGIPGGNYTVATNGRFRYTGQAWIPELGLYDYKARIYSPTLGRFMQTDPIGYGDGLNWYNYAGGDPVNNTDPGGLCGVTGGSLADLKNGGGLTTVQPCSGGGGGSGIRSSDWDWGWGFGGGNHWEDPRETEIRTDMCREDGGFKDCSAQLETPQNNNQCPRGSGSIFAQIAEGAGTVGDYADGVAIGSAALGIATAPTGAGGAVFGGTAIVAGFVGRGAAAVQTGAYLLDGNYKAAGSSALGLIGGEAVGRIAGGLAGRFMARNRMFGNLSAGQARRADLFGDTAGAAGSRVASRAVCK